MNSPRKKIATVVLLLLVGVVCTAVLASRGEDDPSPGAGEVAVVEHAGPGGTDLAITEEEFDALIKDLANEEGLRGVPPEEDPGYEALRTAAVDQLLLGAWLRAEARERGIEIGRDDVAKEREDIIEQAFNGSEREYRRFLASSETTEHEVRADAEERLLAAAIQKDSVPSRSTVSREEIERYYEQNSDQFRQPETRDVRVLLAENRSAAGKALSLLEQDDSPGSWRRVAARLSVDEGTGGSGELHRGVALGEAGDAIDAVMPTASVNELVGPIKSEDGFYLLQVQRITPGRLARLAESRDQIRQSITQQAVTESQFALFGKWGARSFCAEDFRTDRCANG